LTANLSGGKLNHKPFEKRLDRKPQQCLDLEILSPNPIGVINRRNGCGTAVVLKTAELYEDIYS
jgi:hypothetical protein